MKVNQSAKPQKRYAIYYAPEEGSSLEAFGQTWLGRDARSGRTLVQARVEGISSERLLDIVSIAARYGFHGTLKPPFCLRTPNLDDHLFEDIARFRIEANIILSAQALFSANGSFPGIDPRGPLP